MSGLVVLAVDPGSRYTGIVVRRGHDLLSWSLEVRQDNGRLPDGRYVTQVRRACVELLRRAGVDHRAKGYAVGVEGLAWWPGPDGKRRNETHLYGTAIVLGAVLCRWPDAVTVDSGRGAGALHPGSYPEAIRPPVNGRNKDRRQHVRAAWDHSHAAETLHHQRTRQGNR